MDGFFWHIRTFILIPCFVFLLGWQNVAGQTKSLFNSDAVLPLILRGELKNAFRDREDNSAYYHASISYLEGSDSLLVPVKIKTRGHFRKQSSNCDYPPLLLNFSDSNGLNNTLFQDQDKLKLVTPCQDDANVIHEYLVYRLYNLITPKSFKARLVRMTYHDSIRNKISDGYYGILLEDEKEMAKRNNSKTIKIKKLPKLGIPQEDYLKMAVFQYLIGNTDWSVEYLQNIKLITEDTKSLPIAVPYDFDHAGIVRAPYARPAPQLRLKSTLERRYRGYCLQDMQKFEPIFEIFQSLKSDIYHLYVDNPLLSEKYIKETVSFFDDFFETINDGLKAKEAFTYPCDPSGTGNVVIRGMQNKE
jgi:hypothetical protein